jgi:hypothetical protein
MALAHPSLRMSFAQVQDRIDPRMAVARASTAYGRNRYGRLVSRPANTARWHYRPSDGVCQGVIVEAARTNLILYSEQFNDAAWTKTNCSVGANAAVAPDGATTADSLTVSATDGNAAQAVTITTGFGASASVFAKAFASPFLHMALTDGSDTVQVWFNLASGAVGSSSGGGSSVTLARTHIEQDAEGYWRCHAEVTTGSVTTLTLRLSAAASDGAAPASADSIYAWGAMVTAASARTGATSYIQTAGSTVTRASDKLIQPIDTAWFNAAEGSLYMDVELGVPPATYGGDIAVFGGFGDTTSNRVYFWRNSSTGAALSVVSGGTAYNMTQTVSYTPGARLRFAGAWKAGDCAFTVNGAAVSVNASAVMPSGLARFTVGAAPWATAPSAEFANARYREVLYFPFRAANADLITLSGG